MRPVLLSAWMMALVVGAAGADDDPEPPGSMTRELKALQGTWEIQSIRVGGGAFAPGNLPGLDRAKLVLTVSKDRVKAKQVGEAEKESTIKIDAKKKPMHIDMTEKGGRTTLGIYKVEKGEWHIAVLPQGGEKKRPRSFDQAEVMVMVLRKVMK